jgi:hypothetical protein
MNLFTALRQRRQPAQGFGQAKASPEADLHQTFILEPILTPSGLVDVGEDLPDVADLDLDLDLGTDAEDSFDPVDTDLFDGEDLADEDFEDIPFIENLAVDFQFESGYFTVGESGEVTIDYLFDGGKYQGELAIFSLEGMEDLVPGSEDFIQEAANRALSESELGHIVISDQSEGARFSGELGESNQNSGDYLGAKTVQMRAGDKFGFMLVPKGEVSEVAADPAIGGAKTPLFSLATANPDDGLHLGQLVDVTGDGNTFVMEDLRLDGQSDRDYNDLIFQVRGATADVELMDDWVDPAKDWRSTEVGTELVDFVRSEIELPETSNQNVIEFTPEMGFLETPIEVSEGVWFLGGKSPDELNLKITHSNANAADTTNADQLWTGGSLGLNLDGSGVEVGVWDGGRVRGTHQEFTGRVSYGDLSSNSDHATHVAGTIGASGVNSNAHGMAGEVRIKSFDWDSDLQEIRTAAQNGLSLSNHSYGMVRGWAQDNFEWTGFGDIYIDTWTGDRSRFIEDQNFGKYSELSHNLDNVLFDNPYLLSVWSAGNDRDDIFKNVTGDDTYVAYFSKDAGVPGWMGKGWYRVPTGLFSAPGPDGSFGGYDTLSLYQTAKNTLVVGAINDITKDPYNRFDPVISPFSSFGLADDGRLKVDIVANGVRLLSSGAESDTAYYTASGTSMAAPNATGTAALLTQHYKNLYGKAPLSATLKATIIHTAAEAGNVGPDYIFGWGVVDGAAAANFLDAAKQETSSRLIEKNYSGSIQTQTVTSSGSEPLKATIVWTDPAGQVHGDGLDERTRNLVNDLDVWIEGPNGEKYYPWTLNPDNPSAPATRGKRNELDNVEQVLIDNPAPGTYTVHVGHSGNSFNQNYSLLISGIGEPKSTITVTTTDSNASETFNNSDPARFTIARSGGDNSKAETISYSVTGNADNGKDYAPLSGEVTIPAGSDSVVVNIDPIDDDEYEGTEDLTLTIKSSDKYELGSTIEGSIQIQDNDPEPKSTITLTATDQDASETSDGSNPAKFTITRSGGDNSKAETISYSVTGSASNGEDYDALSGEIVIPSGSNFVDIIINPKDDAEYEVPESITIQLSSDSEYELDVLTQDTVWLYDNDPKPTPKIVGVTWNGELYEIDLESKESSLIGNTQFGRLNSLTHDSQGNLLTIANVNSSVGEVIRIDPNTGIGEIYKTFNNDFDGKKASIRGLTALGDNNLYAIHNTSGNDFIGDDALYHINLTTGNTRKIADLGYSGLQSLALSSDGILYSFSSASQNIVSINIVNGETTEIPTTGVPSQPANIQGLTFTPDGELLAVFQLGTGNRTGWYQVDVNSGEITPMQIEENIEFRGIANLKDQSDSNTAHGATTDITVTLL